MLRWGWLFGLALALSTGCACDEKRDRPNEGNGGSGGAEEPPPSYGQLELQIRGIPETVHPNVRLHTPDGREISLRYPAVFKYLRAGVYVVQAPTVLAEGDTYFVTRFRGQTIHLEAGARKVVRIDYEPLPYRVRVSQLTVPWRGAAEFTLQVERSRDFQEPLILAIEEHHPAFEVTPRSIEISPDEESASFLFENTGHLDSVEPAYGFTLQMADGEFVINRRLTLQVAVLVTHGGNDGPGSLREILEQADEIPRPRRVEFAADVRSVWIDSPLVFDSRLPLEIDGGQFPGLFTIAPEPGLDWPPRVWIVGDQSSRILEVGSGTLSIRNVGMQRGVEAGPGGCIRTEGELRLGPGVWIADCEGEVGGAISVTSGGRLAMERSRFYLNDAVEGGALHVEPGGRAQIVDSVFSANVARVGGAIQNLGALELRDAMLSRNAAERGGAIENHGEIQMEGTVLTGNLAEACGALSELSTSRIETSRFDGNQAWRGGAICGELGAELLVRDSTFRENQAELGGAIFLDGAWLEVEGSLFENNRGGEAGGALAAFMAETSVRHTTFSANEGELGGGIHSIDGEIQVLKSEFSENLAAAGGAIYASEILLRNSTLAENRASGPGGAIYIPGGAAALRFLTIVGNEAGEGGAISGSPQALQLGASIVADNLPLDLRFDLGPGAIFDSDGFNILGIVPPDLAAHLIPSDLHGNSSSPLDPRIRRPSGPVFPYFTPERGSDAVDGVPFFYCEKLLGEEVVDQRGVPRPRGQACDIGAIEVF